MSVMGKTGKVGFYGCSVLAEKVVRKSYAVDRCSRCNFQRLGLSCRKVPSAVCPYFVFVGYGFTGTQSSNLLSPLRSGDKVRCNIQVVAGVVCRIFSDKYGTVRYE